MFVQRECGGLDSLGINPGPYCPKRKFKTDGDLVLGGDLANVTDWFLYDRAFEIVKMLETDNYEKKQRRKMQLRASKATFRSDPAKRSESAEIKKEILQIP